METTLKEVETMASGRRMDLLIAMLVVGWSRHRNDRPTTSVLEAKDEWEYDYVHPRFNGDAGHAQVVPRYSTDAGLAIYAAQEAGLQLTLEVDGEYAKAELHENLGFGNTRERAWASDFEERAVVPLVICRALLIDALTYAKLEAAPPAL